MKKKFLAAAVISSICGLAAAQSNVSIYGVMDINYTSASGGGKSMQAIDPGGISGSRLGFRGSEDLGNGLKAIFELEFGSLKIDGDSGITGARQTLVGLQGAFGKVIGGYIYSPADDFNSDYDGLSNSGLLSARSNMLNDGGFSTKVDDTFNNAVGYISPNINGLTLRAVGGLGEQTSGPKEAKLAFSAEYVRGPLKTEVLHHHINHRAGLAADLKETGVGAAYDFGVAKLMGTYLVKKASDSDSDKSWALGAQIPVSAAGSLRLSYARLDMSASSGNRDASGWTAAYFHSLSKRTTLYAGYHALDNSSAASYSHEQLKGLAAGDNAHLVAAGIRHKF